MLKLFNTFGKKLMSFRPVRKELVTVFTCGPSVYQRAHIGNFRTFLFEDILVRYLEFSGYKVKRGLIVTDIEDKTVLEAKKKNTTIKQLTEKNIKEFVGEMKSLKMKSPDILPCASEHVYQAADIIEKLLDDGIAYRYKKNIYFDPLKFPGFGELYGLDMSKWPEKKVRFHKDTYPGIQWNLGDFILWHGTKKGEDAFWDTKIGKGRPSWNIQDASIISRYFDETLSIYCGGIDNLYRHHDYTRAIIESISPYPMARFWLHCHHLYVDGEKMSKSQGNIYYTDMLLRAGYSMQEIRFFLINKHYRETLNFSDKKMETAARKLRIFRKSVKQIAKQAGSGSARESALSMEINQVFSFHMDNDLHLEKAFDGIYALLSEADIKGMKQSEAAGLTKVLKKTDQVLQVIF
jgi:cysteinyl-tRNA synthetase